MHATAERATERAAEALTLSNQMLGLYVETSAASDLSLSRAWARVAAAFMDAAHMAGELS